MTSDEMLLDEYGNPIGQLAVNLGPKAASLTVVDDSVAKAQDAALADDAQDLPGIEPAEVAIYYPGYDDDQKRDRAKRLMLIEGMGVEGIAAKVGVPERTVYMWVANYKWAEAKRKDILARDDVSRMELAETRIRRRNEVFNEQLEQAKAIREKAVQSIKADEVSVKSGAEAWAAAAKTEQTILGLSEAGKVASADGKEDGERKDAGGKQPLVMVFQGGALPGRRAGQ